MSRWCNQITWEDCPHIDEEMKAELLESIPRHMRDARTKGVPMLGAGAIYDVAEESITIETFDIPKWWPRAYGFDVGWNRTAACWGAWDRESRTVYIYAEYYAAHQPPVVHADGIKRCGDWIRGAIDPAAAGSSQKDGAKLMDEYRNLGLHLAPADNAVDAGIFAVESLMTTGRLKILTKCRNLLAELRIYRRTEKGAIVKENDHLCDALRYLIMTGMTIATTEPYDDDDADDVMDKFSRSEITGY